MVVGRASSSPRNGSQAVEQSTLVSVDRPHASRSGGFYEGVERLFQPIQPVVPLVRVLFQIVHVPLRQPYPESQDEPEYQEYQLGDEYERGYERRDQKSSGEDADVSQEYQEPQVGKVPDEAKILQRRNGTGAKVELVHPVYQGLKFYPKEQGEFVDPHQRVRQRPYDVQRVGYVWKIKNQPQRPYRQQQAEYGEYGDESGDDLWPNIDEEEGRYQESDVYREYDGEFRAEQVEDYPYGKGGESDEEDEDRPYDEDGRVVEHGSEYPGYEETPKTFYVLYGYPSLYQTLEQPRDDGQYV